MKDKVNIRTLTSNQIQEWILKHNFPKFRAKQIYHWLWKKVRSHFSEMANLPGALIDLLDQSFFIDTISEDLVQKSDDGTIKCRYKLHDGHLIESVLIPVPSDNRYTVCVSSQVGCSLDCSFCATGKMGLKRNLTAGEIYDQVVQINTLCQEHFDHALTNIVYMGMGEPLLNYRNVLRSVEMITSPDGLHMSPRRITISTAGIAKMIRRLADDNVRFNLALSLHAPTDDARSKIMPINESNNLDALEDALEDFYRQTKNKISYEYIAFNGINVSMEDARALAKRCKRYPVRVNIIEYNPIGLGGFEKAEEDQIDRFAQFLRTQNVMVTVRRSRGKDIDAACGQLANKD
ncbi:MAG: 23S rRNA (adenine(2503)-C(2))-methyltransferase RlmN [Bacteroidia bacterium]|nr:23S rRNA (adenine(2503)-C(2))-methyltransferase RlmN [Bacteroidia bacterium]